MGIQIGLGALGCVVLVLLVVGGCLLVMASRCDDAEEQDGQP